jgi:hypothetical protein
MLTRRYEITSLRPHAGELVIRYVEGDHEVTLNLPPPDQVRDMHRHALRYWPRQRFRELRILQHLAEAGVALRADISDAEVEAFALEEVDE